jgi:hypothetical protein
MLAGSEPPLSRETSEVTYLVENSPLMKALLVIRASFMTGETLVLWRTSYSPTVVV